MESTASSTTQQTGRVAQHMQNTAHGVNSLVLVFLVSTQQIMEVVQSTQPPPQRT